LDFIHKGTKSRGGRRGNAKGRWTGEVVESGGRRRGNEDGEGSEKLGRQEGDGCPQAGVQGAGSMEMADGQEEMGWEKKSGIE